MAPWIGTFFNHSIRICIYLCTFYFTWLPQIFHFCHYFCISISILGSISPILLKTWLYFINITVTWWLKLTFFCIFPYKADHLRVWYNIHIIRTSFWSLYHCNFSSDFLAFIFSLFCFKTKFLNAFKYQNIMNSSSFKNNQTVSVTCFYPKLDLGVYQNIAKHFWAKIS